MTAGAGNRVYRSYEIYAFVAAVYFVCCHSLSLLSGMLGRRLGRAERGVPTATSVMVEGERVAVSGVPPDRAAEWLGASGRRLE